jgi:urease accessory protein
MRNIMRRLFVQSASLTVCAALALTALTSVAFAHPGHGSGLVAGLAHPFSGLDHVLAMVAVGLWAAQLGRPAVWLLPTVFPVVMAAGAAMGVYGVALPWVEAGIVASVVVLGGAVAFGLRLSLVASAMLVGVFALFHGYAHGTEFGAGLSASMLLYGAGFVLATVALHAIGIGIGLLTRAPIYLRAAGGAVAAAGLVLIVAH